MYSYNRIQNDYDNNVVRVELNSTYRPRMPREKPRESARIASSINRNETFTKFDAPSKVIRSETFILKHHDDSSDGRIDHNTFLRSKQKSHRADEKKFDDKSHFSTYTRPEKKKSKCSFGLRSRSILLSFGRFRG